MNYDDVNIDELLSDVKELLDEEPKAKPASRKVVSESRKSSNRQVNEKKKSSTKKPSTIRRVLGIIGRIFAILLETVLLLVICLYGLMYVVAKGPSPAARDLFVMSVRETSAVGFLANIYFTDEEIAQIENKKTVEDYVETDTSLIQIPKETTPPDGEAVPENQGPVADEWGLIDEDGDGIILEEVRVRAIPAI